MNETVATLDAFIIRCLESGKYRVDADGTIWNLDFRGTGAVRRIKTQRSRNGYIVCMLRCDGPRDVRVCVHRVVALAFHRNAWRPEFDVDHVDGDKANNAALNLAFVSHDQNMHRSWKIGLRAPSGRIGQSGSEHHKARLSEADVRIIHRRLLAGEKQRDIASDFGIHQAHVSEIGRGVKWPDIYREFHS